MEQEWAKKGSRVDNTEMMLKHCFIKIKMFDFNSNVTTKNIIFILRLYEHQREMHESYVAEAGIKTYPELKKEYDCQKCDLAFKKKSALKVRYFGSWPQSYSLTTEILLLFLIYNISHYSEKKSFLQNFIKLISVYKYPRQ